MSDELPIAGKTYISSKKAAAITGYAQDYIGQLARGGFIEAQRVGGLWYVFLDSLTSYKANSDEFKPQPPQPSGSHDPESVVSFDGQDYISASRAAKITGYNQDYIGQLARSGKILSRQIGNRWYIERSGLLSHKNDKDKLLAAVQVESVGLARRPQAEPYIASQTPRERERAALSGEYASAGPVLTYFKDEPHDLMAQTKKDLTPVVSPIKIRTLVPNVAKISQPPLRLQTNKFELENIEEKTTFRKRPSDSAIRIATKSVGALTIVVVLSYGIFSLKDVSKYASIIPSRESIVGQDGYLAGAAMSINSLAELLETLLTEELVYIRTP